MNLRTILVVEDDDDLRDIIAKTLSTHGYSCITARNGQHALQCMQQHEVQLILTDVQMPQLDGLELLHQIRKKSQALPVLIMTAYGTIDKAVEALKQGANDYLTKPFESQRLLQKLQPFFLLPSQTETSSSDTIFSMNASSQCIIVDHNSKELYRLAERVAPSDSSVLIYGESGTGKEVLARYIHDHSPRVNQPFVALNCAAIPDNMLEAILFGFEKGAFTGAHQASAGKFEQANGGTLLLDEISEMPLALQAKLLRVLQEREVERIGSKKLIKLNLRVLATTNRQLKNEIISGRFREDLFYRLNVFPLHAKPLRQRQADIVPLANFFIGRYQTDNLNSHGVKKKLSDEACEALVRYQWPGNIRQLQNIIQRCLILSEGSEIQETDLQLQEDNGCENPESENFTLDSNPITDKATNIDNHSKQETNGKLDHDLRNREYELILETLKLQRGSRENTARALGISSRTLRYKMAKMRSAGVLLNEH